MGCCERIKTTSSLSIRHKFSTTDRRDRGLHIMSTGSAPTATDLSKGQLLLPHLLWFVVEPALCGYFEWHREMFRCKCRTSSDLSARWGELGWLERSAVTSVLRSASSSTIFLAEVSYQLSKNGLSSLHQPQINCSLKVSRRSLGVSCLSSPLRCTA